MENSIKIVEVTQVSPLLSDDELSNQNSLHLTSFDFVWLKVPPVERLFFYEFAGSSTEILRKLKQSLSLALSHYRPLAGHLTWGPHDPKPYILCSPTDSVSVVVAESNADNFHKLSAKGSIVNAIELRSYAPTLQITDDAATIISIKITFFPGVGFCIGISAHHGALDGSSSIMFLKSWAYLCRNLDQEPQDLLLPAHLSPCFDRTTIKDPTGNLDKLYLDQWLTFSAPKGNPKSLKVLEFGGLTTDHVRATLDLSRVDINKIREKIMSKSNTLYNDLHLSSFVVAFAHAIVCFVKTKAVETNIKVHFISVANFRSRRIPPLPANYIGNCVISDKVNTVEAKDVVGEDGHVIVAKLISDSIKSMEKYDYFERAQEFNKEFHNLERGPLGYIGVVGSNKLEVYDLDFGWGRPKKVDVVSIDKGTNFSMAETRDQIGAVEIGLVMKNQVELQAFTSHFVNV